MLGERYIFVNLEETQCARNLRQCGSLTTLVYYVFVLQASTIVTQLVVVILSDNALLGVNGAHRPHLHADTQKELRLLISL